VRFTLLSLALTAGLSACVTTRADVGNLAHASVTSDFHTYNLRRVGILPFQGISIDLESQKELEAAFATELSATSGLEVVPLTDADLEEVTKSEPFRKGSIKPATVLALAKRFRLDGLFAGTVSDVRGYVPLRLCIDLDLVASETGLSIWSASARLDASDERVRRGLEQWLHASRGGATSQEGIDIYLMSPRHFVRFAAAQIAALL